MEQLQLRVRGMTCTACEQRIEKALSRLDGITHSAADHRAACVRVMFDPTRTTESTVRSCIERAGYTVRP
jgi:copper chaperone CopZ